MQQLPSIHEIVYKQKDEMEHGNTRLSKYVTFELGETIARIDAAVNSKFLNSQTDSRGNKKSYFNITNSAVNIWFRATDIDRANIKVRPTPGNRLNALIATAMLQEWMRRAKFGTTLNSWGRVLARNGSAVTKFTRQNGELIIETIPWTRIICDSVDFYNNPVSEQLYLSEQQLYERIENNNYDTEAVKDLIDSARTTRKTREDQNKDDLSDYYEIYETHGKLSLEYLTGKEKDRNTYVFVMKVIATTNAGNKDQKDFTLYEGREKQFPYELDHLLEEDGRVMGIGAVENLFHAQWMQNHSMKQIKDQLDFASKQFYQTTDQQFLGANAVDDLDNGHMFVTSANGQISQVNTQSHDTTNIANFAGMWKQLGNELNGISEAMLGASPKSGTAWRQTEALLSENYSLFEIMTENKGLALDNWLRKHIIPFTKDTMLNNADEIVALLDAMDIEWIDKKYLTVKENELKIDAIFKGKTSIGADGQLDFGIDDDMQEIMDAVSENGTLRKFKPSMLSSKTWKEQLKDLEWDVEIDITGEVKDLQQAMTTINTALTVMMNPAYQQNKQAQKLVAKALDLTSTLSPLELQEISGTMNTPQIPQQSTVGVGGLPVTQA